MKSNECPECGTPTDEFHLAGCDIELCPYCGDQLVRCTCGGPFPPLDDRIRWSGVFPGVEECQEFGWYARLVPGQGWVACSRETPGAEPDLYRLQRDAYWDRLDKRFVLKPRQPLARGDAGSL